MLAVVSLLATDKISWISSVVASVVFYYFGFQVLDAGMKSQFFSLLFFAVLIWALRNFVKIQIWFVPFLMWLWANMHGQFVLGLAVLAIYALSKKVGNKNKEKDRLWSVWMVSTLLTLINPFGALLYETVLEHFSSDSYAAIYDWMPWAWGSLPNMLLIIYVIIVLISLWENKQKHSFGEWMVAVLLIFMSFRSRRFVPIMVVFGMINKIKSCVTWGEVDEQTITNLLNKRGRLPGNKRFTEQYAKDKAGKAITDIAKELSEDKLKIKDIPGLKPVFRLKPASKGLEGKGMKAEFSMGGSFGYRGKEINSFLKRMI